MTEFRDRRGLLYDTMNESSLEERIESHRVPYRLPPFDVPRVTPPGARTAPLDLPRLTETDLLRHLTRLSRRSFTVDLGPWSSECRGTRHAPRAPQAIAEREALTRLHPEMPPFFSQGALETIARLEAALEALTGLEAASVRAPTAALAMTGCLLVVRAFHEHHGGARKVVLTASGLPPSVSAGCRRAGYTPIPVPEDRTHGVSHDSILPLVDKYGRDIAALVVAVPSGNGGFEPALPAVADMLHGMGTQLILDGSSLAVLHGFAKPRDLGVDAVALDLVRLTGAPAGGAGAGALAVRGHLLPYLPGPRVRRGENGGYRLEMPAESIGRLGGTAARLDRIGQALAYFVWQGSSGLKASAEMAALTTNYLRERVNRRHAGAGGATTLQRFTLPDGLCDRSLETTDTESLRELDSLAEAFGPARGGEADGSGELLAGTGRPPRSARTTQGSHPDNA